MAMFSTYIAWAMMIDAGFPYWAAFGLTLVSSFAADVAIEEIIIRPVERGPVLNIVIGCFRTNDSSLVTFQAPLHQVFKGNHVKG